MSEALEQSEALHRRVRRFIRGCRDEPFSELGLAVARFQAEHVPVLGRLCAAAGLAPAELGRVEQIPAVPCDVFRLRRVAAFPAAADERCFHTSGTTQPALPGRHSLRTTGTYALAALSWAAAMLWPDGPALRLISLIAPEAAAPRSSLSFMVARFAEQLAGPSSWHVDGSGALDLEGFVRACEAARASGEPALIAGTSFAFVQLFMCMCDALGPRRLELPVGSRVMLTGGFKGRARQIEPAELEARIGGLLGLDGAHVVGEYGMTELSSQLYQARLTFASEPAASRYVAPPWVRVTAVDPLTLAALPPLQTGLGRVIDLANVDSAVAVQTADLVRAHPDGTIELLGRQPGAPPRGCSLALEALGA